MRIAFISDAVYMGHKGGLEYVEIMEATGLARDKKYEVHFISMRWPGMGKDFVKDGIHYHTLSKTNINMFYRHGRRSIRTSLVFTLSMFTIFRYRFDVIEANMFPILHIPILKIYCKLTGCKLILDVVEVWERPYWSEYLKNKFLGDLAYKYASFFLGSAQAYIANSSITADMLRKEGINDERIHVFAPIIEVEELQKVREKAKRKPRVFFSGRFIKEKRLDKWLRIVGDASRKVRLKGLLVGDGPELAQLKVMRKKMKLENVVDIKPFYPDERDMWKQLAGSSVLLMTSDREGLSTITLKSIAMGVPVLLQEGTPIPKEVRDMCVVRKESAMPGTIAEIIRSKNPQEYVKDGNRLRQFSTSNVGPFYAALFTRLSRRN